MKILIISHEYPPRLGGVGIVAKAMNDYFSKEHEVDLIHHKIIFYGLTPKKLWPITYSLFFFFSNFKKYDLIILNDPAVQYSAGLVLSENILNKSISVIHGPEKYILEDAHLYAKFINFKKYFFKAINGSKKKVYVSNYLRQSCEELTAMYKKSNAVVIHNGVEDALVDILENNNNSIISRKENSMLTVCRVEEIKGLDNALMLLSELVKIKPSFQWTIVGSGSYLDELKYNIAHKGLSTNVVFKGAMNRKQLIEQFSTHKYFVHLPNCQESFGLTLLEASLCGCSIVTSLKGGIPEALQYVKSEVYIDEGTFFELSQKIILNQTSSINNNMRKQSDFCIGILNEIKKNKNFTCSSDS